MLVAAVLFALAAVNGLALATCFFTARPRPLPLAMVHLCFAASGLATLAWTVWKDSSVILANISLGIMFVVALMGFVQLSFRLRGMPLYAPLLIVHALGAITGFLFLLVAVLV
jgi:uncharacterized membrane protein